MHSYLGEANVGGLLSEALTADVEAVLADETSRVGADAAANNVRPMFHSRPFSISRAMYPVPNPSSSPSKTRCENVPLPGALAVGAWARVPDGFVRHDCGLYGDCVRKALLLEN